MIILKLQFTDYFQICQLCRQIALSASIFSVVMAALIESYRASYDRVLVRNLHLNLRRRIAIIAL